MFKATKYPSSTDHVFHIDSIDELTREIFRNENPKEPLENFLVYAGTTKDENLEVTEMAGALEGEGMRPKYKKNSF